MSSGFLFLGGYKNTIDVEKNWAELNFGIGRQFYLFKIISLDLYFGPSIYFAHSEQTTITESINLTEIGTIETENYDFGRIIKPNIVIENNSKQEINFQKLNYAKAIKDLKWLPKTSLRIGLKKTIEWYKNNY